MHIYVSEMIKDVQLLMDEQKMSSAAHSSRSRTTIDSSSSSDYFDNYRPPEEVFAYIDSLVSYLMW